MARDSMFVLKMPLNPTNQLSLSWKVKNWNGQGKLH